MSTSITDDVYLDHAPERVWRALTTSEVIARWLMADDFEPRLGHRFTFRDEPVPPRRRGLVAVAGVGT